MMAKISPGRQWRKTFWRTAEKEACALEPITHPRTAHPCACACSGIAVAPVMALEAASLRGPTVGLKAVGESVEKPLLYYQVNLEGMLNLVQELIPRFVTAG